MHSGVQRLQQQQELCQLSVALQQQQPCSSHTRYRTLAAAKQGHSQLPRPVRIILQGTHSVQYKPRAAPKQREKTDQLLYYATRKRGRNLQRQACEQQWKNALGPPTQRGLRHTERRQQRRGNSERHSGWTATLRQRGETARGGDAFVSSCNVLP